VGATIAGKPDSVNISGPESAREMDLGKVRLDENNHRLQAAGSASASILAVLRVDASHLIVASSRSPRQSV
jgi:hypothetical protein